MAQAPFGHLGSGAPGPGGQPLHSTSQARDGQPAAAACFLASHDHANCKAALALRVIQGPWTLLILRELSEGTLRVSELQRGLSGVSQTLLTSQLRELEADGVVERSVHPQVPPRVDYALTGLGRELTPVLEGLHGWGEKQQGER